MKPSRLQTLIEARAFWEVKRTQAVIDLELANENLAAAQAAIAAEQSGA